MATLNTLRTKGGIIVSVVIGIALIAFLLGDLSRADGMMRSSKMQVGEINGSKIGYQEYDTERNFITEVSKFMSGSEALTGEEENQMQNAAWESMVMKYSYKPGFEELGIAALEAEQIDMVSGIYISPVIGGIFTNPSTGIFDPALLRNFISNADVDASGRTSMVWDYLKEQMTNQRIMSKFMNLASKGLFVNDLEVEQGLSLANNSFSVRYIMQGYSSIADADIKITDAQIREYYKKHNGIFKQPASRDIEYVVFEVSPSAEDFAEAAKYVGEIAADFELSTTPMNYATLNSQVAADTRYQNPADVDKTIYDALASGAMYGPILDGDTYTISRLTDTRMMPDSLGASHILLPADQASIADSLVKVLKNGGNFAELATQYSVDQNANQKGGDLGIFTPDRMIPEFSDACIKANKGDIFTVATQYGTHIVKLTFKTIPVKKVQIATITYKVDPSSNTQQIVYGQASKFISDVANKYDNFTRISADSTISKRVAHIRNTDRNISGMDNSREIVHWAFNAKDKTISSVMTINGNYVIAALNGVREAGIAPLEQMTNDIRNVLIYEKKQELVAAKMIGSSLDEIASKLGAEIVSTTGVNYQSFFVEGAGVELAFVGAICSGIEIGKLSKPVKGQQGVFVFDVTTVEKLDNATLESEKVRLQAMNGSYLMERVNSALNESSKITDTRVKFF